MDRDRMGAWVASLGNHPHAPYFQQILGEYDIKASEADVARRNLGFALEGKAAAEREAQVARSDAQRLAEWIIHHPSGTDPSEVLNLHDRCRPSLLPS